MSSPVRVCLAGAGRAGKVHANSLVNHVLAGTLVGVVDAVPEALNSTADQFGVDARFESLEAALEWNKFDAVAGVLAGTKSFLEERLVYLDEVLRDA